MLLGLGSPSNSTTNDNGDTPPTTQDDGDTGGDHGQTPPPR